MQMASDRPAPTSACVSGRALILSLLMLLNACEEAGGLTARADKIELRAPRIDVTLDRTGRGISGLNRQDGTPPATAFQLKSQTWNVLRARIAAFEGKAGPIDETTKRFLSTNCSHAADYVADAGMISIRWISRDLDRIYLVDLGCDPGANAGRNRKLRALVQGLPQVSEPPLG